MGDIIIWRKSIQKKGLCPVCNSHVMLNGEPTNNVVIDAEKANDDAKVLWCRVCCSKKVPTILGTSKRVDNTVIDAARMYEGLNYSKIEKLLSKDINNLQQAHEKINELKELNRRLEFRNSMLEGNMNQLKTQHEKELIQLRNENAELMKELKGVENAYRRLMESIGL